MQPLRVEDVDEMAPILDDERLHEYTGGRPVTYADLGAAVAAGSAALMRGLSSVTEELSAEAGSRTWTYTGRSTAVHTTASCWLVSTS